MQSFPPHKEAGSGGGAKKQHSHAIASHGASYPIARAGQPAECAPAYVFLADGKASSYVAGEILAVTGGKSTA